MSKRDSPSETLRERNGQAEIWTPEQITCILAELRPQRMQALFAICYYPRPQGQAAAGDSTPGRLDQPGSVTAVSGGGWGGSGGCDR